MTVEEKVRGFGPLAEDLRRRGAVRGRFISTFLLKEPTVLLLSYAPPFELAVDWWIGVDWRGKVSPSLQYRSVHSVFSVDERWFQTIGVLVKNVVFPAAVKRELQLPSAHEFPSCFAPLHRSSGRVKVVDGVSGSFVFDKR